MRTAPNFSRPAWVGFPILGEMAACAGCSTLRGGLSFYPPKAMRSAMRVCNVPDFRNFSVGFRVARDLVP